jgi:ribosomal protein L23
MVMQIEELLHHRDINAELFEKICQDIERCKDSTRLVAERNGISDILFDQFMNASPQNVIRYAQAKEKQAEFLLDEIHVIEDKLDSELKSNDPKIANAIATSYRMKVDNIKWILSKLKPKKYGDRLEVDGKVIPESVLVMSEDGKELFELKSQEKEKANEKPPEK